MAANRKIGVLGVGFGSDVHVPGLRSEGWDVAAVYSRNEDRARSAAESLGIDSWSTDAMEIIGRDDLDAIAIATPPRPHSDLAVAALEAGKHVICEKPFAVNAEESAQMRDAAKASGKVAMVAHEFRYTPQRTLIKELIEDGFLGKPQTANFELLMGRPSPPGPAPMTWASRKAEGGGFLGALGSHYIDGLRFWFGDVATASGHLSTLRPDRKELTTGANVASETDDAFSFILTHVNGVVSSMTASSVVSPSTGARLTVAGTKGVLQASQPGPNPPEDGVVFGSNDGGPLKALPTPERLTPFTDDRDPRLMAFRLFLREFNRAIDTGAAVTPNFDDGHACQQVLDAIRQSSETGRVVPII
ncbi:MAG: Gfo/Idh/MocA family oxidoreductase [Chloroflexi bacterium]|nr:Gfo/Idh/MocA family oxidoreductase [Chloroflexota bacterium]